MLPKQLPDIKEEIDHSIKETKDRGVEHSLTICKIKNRDEQRVYGHARGNRNYTTVEPCGKRYGNTDRIGDFHVHPSAKSEFTKDTLGVTPSEEDFTANLEDSLEEKKVQISCIGNPDSRNIHCFLPTRVPNKRKTEEYFSNLESDRSYFLEHIAQDFEHGWYDRKNLKRINPSAEQIVKDAFGDSGKYHRERVEELRKGALCQQITDYNAPGDKQVTRACRNELKQRRFIFF